MAKKVLVSFLGTGSFDQKEKRTYKTANYHLGGTELGDYPFVAAALKKHYDIDKVILVGTVHSMWEEVYKWFCEENGQEIDMDVWTTIGDACENASSKTELAIPHQDKIEQAIGHDAKVVLIKYGISESEIKENIDIILGIQQYLDQNDELIVDVTHSFRSLPMFIMNLLIYLKNVCPKNITISHIHYGMLEMAQELGYAPIIELGSIMEVNEWITGAYSFSEFGNAYKISQLVESQDRSVSNLLDEFSDLMNLNHLHAIQNISQRLAGIRNKDYQTLLPKLTINPIVESFVRNFSSNDARQSVFQLKVARWQLEHRKYAQAMLTITEAIITYVCEKNNLEWDGYENREGVKKALTNPWSDEAKMLNFDKELSSRFKELNKIRNSTAHSLESSKNVEKMLRVLNENVKQLEKVIQRSH